MSEATPDATPDVLPETLPDDAGPAGETGAAPRYEDDPHLHEAVIDLLGVLAYGELTGFTRLAVDSDLAPDQPLKAKIASLAVAEFHHYEALVARLEELGADPEQAMAPFTRAVDVFHDRTRPSSFLEGLVKAYVGDGIATDFYREISAYVDPHTATLVREVLTDVGKADFVVSVVGEAIREDHRLGGPLALWGRRLVGEALSQAQAVAVERDALASLLVGGVNRPGADLAEIGRMFTRITEEHTRRMERLGLTA